jgi:flagellar biosynthesis/type III secretory pathway ATPase
VIEQARRLLGAYDRAELMIQAGLYAAGSDPVVDAAIRAWPALDAFIASDEAEDTAVRSADSRRPFRGVIGTRAAATNVPSARSPSAHPAKAG